jgi:hypothetical protein
MNLGILGKLASYGTSSVPAQFDAIHAEILGGLKNERPRLDAARMARNYYEGNVEAYQTAYERELGVHGSAKDYVYRSIPFVRAIVDAKIRRLYMSDPKRTITDQPTATEYLNDVYSKARLTPKLKDSLKYAALGGVAAIQVEINQSSEESHLEELKALRRPAVNFRLWSADEFCVWCSPDEPISPYAVAVLDRYDNQTRCRLWTPEVLVTYTSKKWDGSTNTAGTRVFEEISREENWLGLTPFFFQWWTQPTKDFWVWAPGPELVRVNQQADARLTKIADDTMFTRPITYARNVHENWRPPARIVAGAIEKLTGIIPETIGDAAYDGPSIETTTPDLNYLLSDREELESYLDVQAELHGVPKEQWRNRPNGATSGVAIISEALPVIEFCETQQVLMEDTEKDAGLLTLMVVNAMLGGNADMTAAITNYDLTVQWPPLTKNRPGDEFDKHIQMRAVNGWDSPIQSQMQLTGSTEAEAIEHFERMAEHKKLLDVLMPPMVDPAMADPMAEQPENEDETDDETESNEEE